MDYGRTLVNTYEIGDDGSNFAYKGIAVRLDRGPGGVSRGRHWMVFDHDTLRMAAAWSGNQFIDWKGIHFNGQHAIHPRVLGKVHLENKTGPGWASPNDDSWHDARLIGRDDRHYGPLPRDWGHYQGMYYHGDQTVIAYRIGQTPILEQPQLLAETPEPIFARKFEVGPRSGPLTLQVAQLPPTAAQLSQLPSNAVLLGPQQASQSAPPRAQDRLAFDGATYAQLDQAGDFDFTHRSFTITSRFQTERGGSLLAKTAPDAKWVPDGKALFVRGGRLCYDIGWVGVVQSRTQVADGQPHQVALSWDHRSGVATLYVDGKKESQRVLRPKKHHPEQVLRIGFAAANFPGPQSFFDGQIDSLRFFDQKLTAEQIAGREDPPRPMADWNLTGAANSVTDRINSERSAVIVQGKPTSAGRTSPYLVAGVKGNSSDLRWSSEEGKLRLTLPAGDSPLTFTVWFASVEQAAIAAEVRDAVDKLAEDPASPSDLVDGGPARLPETILTRPLIGGEAGPFAVDVLTRPATNPWLARVRLTGFDFFPDGDSAAVCSWDGDVWKVSGVDSLGSQLQWKRIATGLFQPLGVRIVDGDVYVTCRDQLTILRDKNGDGEIDFFENFNNDHQVTDHFHEFAMGLQTDAEGNFYYAKSARHALPAVVPHHGTLLRVSKDGARTDIVANGFRAANGVCLNPDGSFIVTDQEGHWNPKNRINWVREGGFYGNMFGYHNVTDSSDAAMEPPLCWITNNFDRSPAELLWVPDDCWGPLGGSLLNLSYGCGKVFVVPHEQVGETMQGGMCELPMPQFPTGLVRGRFHPTNGHLYTCGMFAWAGNQQQPGGFYRIRPTGKPMHLPVKLHAETGRVVITFTDPISRAAAENPDSYHVSAWDLKRTANYGSKHYNERSWPVRKATLSADGQTITLEIANLAPTWGMEIRCFLKSVDDRPFERRIHNTVHRLAK
ncbi:MAG: LamG domain-containing protein, partial [Pirellulales bacterium]|nr:LamG domain-containing protein [Pirellulales bacterium]